MVLFKCKADINQDTLRHKVNISVTDIGSLRESLSAPKLYFGHLYLILISLAQKKKVER